MPIETKSQVDATLWKEALQFDSHLFCIPVRTQRVEASRSGPEHVFISPNPSLKPLRLLPGVLLKRRRNEQAYVAIPDGSNAAFEALPALAADKQLRFDEKLNFLHTLGTKGHMEDLLSLRGVVRMAQYGVTDISGRYRPMYSGFEYGVFNSSHPANIAEQMKRLGIKVEQVIQTIIPIDDRNIPGVEKLREELAKSRFCAPERIDDFTDKELLTFLFASDIQRIIAYIHPWYERIGRTSEEGLGLFALSCGINPLFLSEPENRSTLPGYERGIVNAVTAIGVLREVARRFCLAEAEISKIFQIKDFFSRLPDTHPLTSAIYKSPLKYIYGRNMFPKSSIMDRYFQEVHNIVIGLIDTMGTDTLINDPHTIYLAGHLIGRGKHIPLRYL